MPTRIFEDLAEFYPLWRDTSLGIQGSGLQETDFIQAVFKSTGKRIHSVIDLGGGVGTHSHHLLKQGYDVTLFDQSEKALGIAQKNNPQLKIVPGSFETIGISQDFDAAICMWSTLSYILNTNGRNTFYSWIRDHIRHLAILDEANFYRYTDTFHKVYEGENGQYKLKATRDWILGNDNTKKTKWVYEVFNKATGKTETIEDGEVEHYLTVDELKQYLGQHWKLSHLLGSYSLDGEYDKENSSRIITIFEK